MDTLLLPSNKFQRVEATMPGHRSEILGFLRKHGLCDIKIKQQRIDGLGPY